MPAFGAEVRTAGTASLLVNLPAVAVSVLRYQRQGAHRDPGLLAHLALPIYAPGAALKLLLGLPRRVGGGADSETPTGFSILLHIVQLKAGTWRSFAPADASRTTAGVMALLAPCGEK